MKNSQVVRDTSDRLGRCRRIGIRGMTVHSLSDEAKAFAPGLRADRLQQRMQAAGGSPVQAVPAGLVEFARMAMSSAQ